MFALEAWPEEGQVPIEIQNCPVSMAFLLITRSLLIELALGRQDYNVLSATLKIFPSVLNVTPKGNFKIRLIEWGSQDSRLVLLSDFKSGSLTPSEVWGMMGHHSGPGSPHLYTWINKNTPSSGCWEPYMRCSK